MHSRPFNALALAVALLVLAGTARAAEDPIGSSTVAGVREALRKDSKATSTTQHGWTVVASREKGAAIEWFFTPEGHAVYPAVVKRKVVEHDGVGEIELAALCETDQEPCDQLLEDFRQTHRVTIAAPHVERVTLDVGIAENEHDRVRVNRMIAENGMAAEIRMDGQLKAVIVPTVDEKGAVTLWAAMYEFDGRDFALVAEPQLVSPGDGRAEVELAAASGNRFAFSIASSTLPRE